MTTHRMSYSRTYRIWQNMNRRCREGMKSCEASYVARRITVCPRWASFVSFYEDMGDAPKDMSIDRIDNKKGYYPGNCRWATRNMQQNNMCSNRIVVYKGVHRTLSQWARIIGMYK